MAALPRQGGAGRDCTKYRKLTGTTGFAYHPYTRPAGPGLVEGSPDDATIRSLGRVTRALDIARRKRRLGGGRAPVWITEFGFQSNPPDHIFGAKLSRIPGFMGESELWSGAAQQAREELLAVHDDRHPAGR